MPEPLWADWHSMRKGGLAKSGREWCFSRRIRLLRCWTRSLGHTAMEERGSHFTQATISLWAVGGWR